MDSRVAIELIMNNRMITRYNGVLIERYKALIEQEWTMEFQHIYREANKVVGWHANWAIKHGIGEHMLLVPPERLLQSLRVVAQGVKFARLQH